MPFPWLRHLSWTLSCCLYTLTVHAQTLEDHLQPADSYYTSGQVAYYSKVQEVLYAGLRGKPLARVVVLPSLLPEYILSLDRQAGKVYLTYQTVHKTSIWHEMQSKTGVTPPLDTKVVELKSEVASALTQLFTAAVGQTRYPKPTDSISERSDGTTFTFIIVQPHVGWQAGQVWSPATYTRMGRLVTLVEQLRKVATTSNSSSPQTALLKECNELTIALASE